MSRLAARTERGVPVVRPMRSGSLFPRHVTVDRNIVRLFMATAISCLQLATMLYGGKLALANLATSAAYVLWAIAGLFPLPYKSWMFRAPGWMGRAIELGLCGAIIATGGPMLIAFLASAVALFMPRDYLRHITRWTAAKAMLIAALVSAALFAGHRLLPDMTHTPANPIDEAFAALVFSLFAAAMAGGKAVSDRLTWDDELSYHVAFGSAAPAERLLDLLAERISSSAVMIFASAPDRPASARILDGGAVATLELGPDVASALLAPICVAEPFLFDSGTGTILRADQRGRVGTSRRPDFARAWNASFEPVRGSATPVAVGRMRGWLYVVTGEDLSHRSYLQLRRLFDDFSGMILRFERFESWRERTLAEARLLASRDMHDSVLQTLAGVRMQLGSMVKASESDASARLREQIASLDGIVAAEQRHLRAVLKRSHEDAETAAELFSYLEARARSLARQWNLRCTVEVPDETLPVSEETAIECEFLLREAISNAAQHAGARHIQMAMGLDDNTLLVTLRTEGLPPGSGRKRADGRMPVESRSLRQRVEKLGGSAYLESVSGGGILSIQIPLERK